jgi:hypothetical protein
MVYKSNKPSKEEDIQRKLAEQISEKAKLPPEEIQKRVTKFIKSSQESLGGAEIKPPYRRPLWYDKFFSLIQQRTINQFSLEFIKLNIVSAVSEAYKFKNGLLFLDLIDKKGNPTSKLEKLRVTGEAFTKNLAYVINQAYADLFETVVVEKAIPESVINYMIERYGYSRPLAEEATALFIYFCDKAKIPISSELINFRLKAERKEKAKETKARWVRPETITKLEYDESFATLKFDDFIFAVKKDLAAIQFARNQVNSLLDYLTDKLSKERSKNSV